MAPPYLPKGFLKDYDPAGRFTQRFTYLGFEDRIVLARAGDQTLSLYLDGQGIDEHLGVASEKDVFAYETDHLGSVLNTDPAGYLRGYGAFGETIGFGPWITKHSDPVMYGFVGRAYDAESDLYYNRARMYDPTTGRFTTVDPIGFAGGDANLYRYVRNNPLRWTDPSGLVGVVGASAGFVSGAVGGYITGGVWGAAVGGVVGAGVGFVAPWQSSYAGAAAAGFVASVAGQGLGNVVAGQPVGKINPVVALSSGLGGASGAELAIGLGLGVNATAAISGIAAGISELGANAISPGPTSWGNAYDLFLGPKSNACGW